MLSSRQVLCRVLYSSTASYYDILNVSKSASSAEIKKAFFDIAKKYHPDTNKDPDAPKKFIEAKKAYEVLSDANKRQLYDSGAHSEEVHQKESYSAGDSNDAFRDVYKNFSNFDFFNELFSEQQARDIETSVKIDFILAAKGGSQAISIKRQMSCKTCNGKGHKGSSKTACFSCNGSGYNTSLKGGFVFTSTCRVCRGSGKSFKDICGTCNGKTFVDEYDQVVIDIPSGKTGILFTLLGVETGDVMRYLGKGNYLNGRAGNLFVQFQVLPHKEFKREQENILSKIDISLVEAVEGCTKRVDTIYGPIDLQIPNGTQPGQKLRMRYKGLKSSKTGKCGDQIVTVNVNIPNLEPSQISALKNALGISNEPDQHSAS